MNYCMSGKKKTVSLIIIGLLVILMGRMFYGSLSGNYNSAISNTNIQAIFNEIQRQGKGRI